MHNDATLPVFQALKPWETFLCECAIVCPAESTAAPAQVHLVQGPQHQNLDVSLRGQSRLVEGRTTNTMLL